jgi:predicted nucleotidyltransferase
LRKKWGFYSSLSKRFLIDMSRLDLVKNYMKYARQVKKITVFYDAQAKVILFGSTLRGDFTGASDIDILIVSKRKRLGIPN